jgi:hypothetical protein
MHLHAIPPHKVQKSPPLNVQSYMKTRSPDGPGVTQQALMYYTM